MSVVQPAGPAPRLFYLSVAVAAALIVFAGFAPSFYLRAAEAGPLKPLLLVHGLVFTAWLGLFVAQTALIPARKVIWHRRLGWAGLGLAAAMVVLGVMAGVDSLGSGSSPPGLDPRVFAMLPFGDIAIFAGLIAWAAAKRRKADWHKRLMVMATVSLMTPALARIIIPIGGGAPLFLLLTALLVAGVIAFDWIAHRRVHPAYLWSGAVIALGKPLLLFVAAPSPPWLALMDRLAG